MRALALDIATTTGVAFDGPDGRPMCQTFRVDAADLDDYGSRYVQFSDWLAGLIAVAAPTLIGFEAPLPVRGGNIQTNLRTVRLLGGLAAHAESEAVRAGIEVIEENVSTIKKHLTGNGHAAKHEIVARCRQLGWTVRNDHEADAASLWSYMKACRDPQFSHRAPPLFAGGAA